MRISSKMNSAVFTRVLRGFSRSRKKTTIKNNEPFDFYRPDAISDL